MPVKKTATKKTTTKKAASNKTAKKPTTTKKKPVTKKTTASKKATAKKKPASIKKAATTKKMTTAKKTPAKKVSTAKKTTAKKTTTTKKTATAKKTTTAKKATTAKKTATKKNTSTKAIKSTKKSKSAASVATKQKLPTIKFPTIKSNEPIKARSLSLEKKTTTGVTNVVTPIQITSQTVTKQKETIPKSNKAVKDAESKTPLGTQVAHYVEKAGEEYMNEEQKAHIEKILILWRQSLMEEVDRTVTHMKDEAANFPDPSDRASQEEEFSLELRTRDRERKLIKKIEDSLESLRDDDFGYCEDCGIEIGIKRLEARPTATLCIDCKTLAEIRERQSR